MQFRDDPVGWAEQQKRERDERYDRHTRQRTKGNEENKNAFEPPAIGFHTTKPTHTKSQSEGHEDLNEGNLDRGEFEDDENDLVLGTPLKTCVLKPRSRRENGGTHTPKKEIQNKGKIP